MRKIKVIFSKADKELAEKLRCKYEKLSDRYLDLAIFFRIIAGIALSAMFAFIAGAVVKNSLYYIAVAGISLISAIILFLISYIFQSIHDDCFMKSLHYQFMLEHMQETLKYGNSLELSVSKTCPNTVIYNLPDCRARHIEAINNIPADGNVIITVKENVDAKKPNLTGLVCKNSIRKDNNMRKSSVNIWHAALLLLAFSIISFAATPFLFTTIGQAAPALSLLSAACAAGIAVKTMKKEGKSNE